MDQKLIAPTTTIIKTEIMVPSLCCRSSFHLQPQLYRPAMASGGAQPCRAGFGARPGSQWSWCAWGSTHAALVSCRQFQQALLGERVGLFGNRPHRLCIVL